MTYTIQEYIPLFIDTDHEPVTDSVETLDELMALPWVKKWTQVENFHRFSVAQNTVQPSLMAEFNNGLTWWVTGFFKGSVPPELPTWTPPEAL